MICDISTIASPTANDFSIPVISDLSDVGPFIINNLSIPIISGISNIAETEVSNIAGTGCINTTGGQDDSFVGPPVDISNNTVDGTNALYDIRKKYVNNVAIGRLNINSLANKFDGSNVTVKNQVDILVLVETKLDDTFPEDQFCIEGFSKPYRLDRNRNGGGVMYGRIFLAKNSKTISLQKMLRLCSPK